MVTVDDDGAGNVAGRAALPLRPGIDEDCPVPDGTERHRGLKPRQAGPGPGQQSVDREGGCDRIADRRRVAGRLARTPPVNAPVPHAPHQRLPLHEAARTTYTYLLVGHHTSLLIG